MSRIISIGKQDFVSLRKNHYFYIDESSFYPHSIEFNKKGLYPTKIRQALCHFSYFLDTVCLTYSRNSGFLLCKMSYKQTDKMSGIRHIRLFSSYL